MKSTKVRVIDEIVSHNAPHADEYLAEVYAYRYGQDHFRLVDSLKHGYVSASVGNIAHLFPTKLFFGAGGGPYDDHGGNHAKSCCELFAESLGINERPEVIMLLEAVTSRDKRRAKQKNTFTVPRVINIMHRYGVPPEKVQRWASILFHAITDAELALIEDIKRSHRHITDPDQRRAKVRREFMAVHRPWQFLTVPACSHLLGEDGPAWLQFAEKICEKQKAAFDTARKVASQHLEEYKTSSGLIRILSVDGSNGEHAEYELEFDAVSRSLKADLVLVTNSKGNTFMGANPSMRDNLHCCIGETRKAESERRGVKLTHQQLYAEGTVEELPQWHVHEMIDAEDKFRRFYNGTTTRELVEPSILSFQEKKEILLRSFGIEPSVAVA